MKMNRFITILAIFMVTLMCFTNDAKAYSSDPTNDTKDLIFHEENHKITGDNFTDLDGKVNELKDLEEGTIIVRFRYEQGSIMSLFSLSNKDLANDHFHVYITPSSIGLENRSQGSNTHIKEDVTLKGNEIHTLALVVDKKEGYKFFLNGELVLQDSETKREFLNKIHEPNSAQLGRTERAGNSNNYPFNGVIDFAEVYAKPLKDEDLINITGVTEAEPLINPLPNDALITDPYSVFHPGLYDSNAYRIPALYHTMDGTLIAGIDKRIDHAGDSPANIDMLVRRSADQGDTWEDDGILINDYPGYASNIDQALLQDKDTKRLYSLVLGFPEGGGFPTATKGNGFKEIDGNNYMVLHDDDNNEYTIREDGVVYDDSNERTDYTVDEKRNLYVGDTKKSNIFLAESPLKPKKTSYLELWHSDDDGLTWDGPKDLNGILKEDWMAFLGAGPGSAIQLTEGTHEGRLVFPIYFTNENGAQASAVIYSDDHGETWERGESPNEGRIVNGETLSERTFSRGSNEITEAQVLEMPDGQLKLFMRNYSGYAQIATSFDGGETWDSEVVTERDLVAPYSQMTAIRYNGLIDGHEAVIFASAGHGSQRINGTVKAGLIKEDGTYSNGRTKYTFDWKYSQLVKEGAYGYSSLTNLDDGNIGLLYEAGSNMDFIKFNPAYLKWERDMELPLPSLESIQIESKTEEYFPGDPIEIKAVFDKFVMLSGDRTLTGTIGNKEVVLELKQKGEDGTAFVFEGELPELEPGEYDFTAEFSTNTDIRNVYGEKLDKSSDANKLSTNLTVSDVPLVENALDIKAHVEHFEKQGEFEDNVAHALKIHLVAVNRFEKKEVNAKVIKHMNSFKLLLEHYNEEAMISEDAYQALKEQSDHLIKKWE